MINKVERTVINKIYIRSADIGNWTRCGVKDVIVHLFGYMPTGLEECLHEGCFCLVYGDGLKNIDVMSMVKTIDKKITELNKLRINLALLGVRQ